MTAAAPQRAHLNGLVTSEAVRGKNSGDGDDDEDDDSNDDRDDDDDENENPVPGLPRSWKYCRVPSSRLAGPQKVMRVCGAAANDTRKLGNATHVRTF